MSHPPLLVSCCRALTALQPQLHTTMTPDSWIAFCLRHPYLLYPVILFQNELRTALFGVSFWEGQTTYRSDLCDQQYLPFGKFLHDLLSGKLDPRYEKRRMRNKSATIIMNPTQNQYFSNRKGVHSFEDQQDQEEADVKTHVHPSRRASRSPAAASGTSTSGSKTPTSVSMTASVSEVTNGGGRSSSPSSARKFFTFHPNRYLFLLLPQMPLSLFSFSLSVCSFLSLLSVRSSSSPAPAATTAAASSRTAQQPSEQSATRISSPVRFVHFAPFPTTIHSGSGSDSPNKFDPPPLERLPSDILKERRRQELIHHKSIKQQARFGRASSKSSYRFSPLSLSPSPPPFSSPLSLSAFSYSCSVEQLLLLCPVFGMLSLSLCLALSHFSSLTCWFSDQKDWNQR
jgi:hypothetical protein